MSEKNLQAKIMEELDATLILQIAADVEARAQREVARRADSRVSALSTEAQRLRMSLFAIEGDFSSSAGDANVANSKRIGELKRAPR